MGITFFLHFFFQFDVCKHLIQRIRSERGLLNKIKCIFYGPGWSPGKPRTGDIADIPKVLFVKKGKQTSKGIKKKCFVFIKCPSDSQQQRHIASFLGIWVLQRLGSAFLLICVQPSLKPGFLTLVSGHSTAPPFRRLRSRETQAFSTSKSRKSQISLF